MADVIQRDVFFALGRRVDGDQLYIRNAVQDPATRPTEPFNPSLFWPPAAQASLAEYRQLVARHRPKVIISFGYFAFAFALGAVGEGHTQMDRTGTLSRQLGREFRKRVAAFDLSKTNLLPLLHRSIGGGTFMRGHEEFWGREGVNYYGEVGRAIAALLIRHEASLDCWVKRPTGPVVDPQLPDPGQHFGGAVAATQEPEG